MCSIKQADYIDLIGKPFKVGGRGPDSFDCYGLVMEIYRRMGIHLRDEATPESMKETMRQLEHGIATEWRSCEVKPGAALAFRRGRFVDHCGIAITNDRFIHADQGVGSVSIARLNGGFLPKNYAFAGAYEYLP